MRYIDDLLIIWNGDQVSFDKFMANMNSNSKNNKLTWTTSTEQIVYLDLEIFKDRDCSKQSDYLLKSEVLANRFIEKGSILNDQNKVSEMDRQLLLQGGQKC